MAAVVGLLASVIILLAFILKTLMDIRDDLDRLPRRRRHDLD